MRIRFMRWLLPRLIILAAGIAIGYYARDQQGKELKRAYEETVAELAEMREAGQDLIERGRRAGEGLRAGAEAAADSTRAAVEEIVGESKN